MSYVATVEYLVLEPRTGVRLDVPVSRTIRFEGETMAEIDRLIASYNDSHDWVQVSPAKLERA